MTLEKKIKAALTVLCMNKHLLSKKRSDMTIAIIRKCGKTGIYTQEVLDKCESILRTLYSK